MVDFEEREMWAEKRCQYSDKYQLEQNNHLANSNWSDLNMGQYLAQVGTIPAEFMVFSGEYSLIFYLWVFFCWSMKTDESSICKKSICQDNLYYGDLDYTYYYSSLEILHKSNSFSAFHRENIATPLQEGPGTIH